MDERSPSQNIFRDSDFPIGEELEKSKAESVKEIENKENKNVDDFVTKTGKHIYYLVKQKYKLLNIIEQDFEFYNFRLTIGVAEWKW